FAVAPACRRTYRPGAQCGRARTRRREGFERTRAKGMSDNDLRDFDTSDFYSYERLLTDPERELLHAVRTFTATEVAPVLLEHWSRATFPFQIVPAMRKLGIAGLPYHGFGCGGQRFLLDGMIAMELARTDCSIADRKSTRLNSSHTVISYAVFCLKKK